MLATCPSLGAGPCTAVKGRNETMIDSRQLMKRSALMDGREIAMEIFSTDKIALDDDNSHNPYDE
jgi:hypothetical protein